MSIPIQFPHPADVIAEEANRFRRLSTAEQAREFAAIIEVGHQQLIHNPQRVEVEACILESEQQWRDTQRRLFKEHGC